MIFTGKDNLSINRLVLYFYWLFAILLIIAYKTVYLLSVGKGLWSTGHRISPDLIHPCICMLALLITTEMLYRIIHNYFDYLLIGLGFIFSMVIILLFSQYFAGIYMVLVFPIVISLFYFNTKKLWFASILTLVGFFVMLPFMEFLQDAISIYDLLGIVLMVFSVSILGHAILIRAKELQVSLARAIRSETEAFADSIAIESDSKYDYLTGLYNHITIQEYMTALIHQHESYGMPLQLAILDIDDFKNINDSLGHHLGDRVLQETACLLRSSISSDDVVARYGGEEFVLLLTGKTSEKSFERLEQIRERLEELHFPELEDHQITVSIGMVDYSKNMGKEGLFKLADSFLYEAKRSGKNKTVTHPRSGTCHAEQLPG
ncbi:MAG: diguanylate cyclase [Gorillibacterium sp.]|nr:diguanylate cyclase [Gorillibacterium sp.]